MTPYVIPTYFTALNGWTPVINQMNNSLAGLNNNVATVNQSLSNSLFSPNAVKLGVVAGVGLAIKSLGDYEQAVANFRVYIGNVSDRDFSGFKKAIESTAVATKGLASTIEIADAFKKIAINPEFAKTPESMAEMAKQAVVLNKAAGGELMQTTQDLVAIMNQYGYSADKAARVSNTLAAGLTIGGSSIQQTSEAMRVFGAVASQMNTPIEQSVALVQVLSQKNILAADAGEKLKQMYLALQKSGLGYKNGIFDINTALEQVGERLAHTTNEQQRNAMAMAIFGETAYTTGITLVSSIDKFHQFTQQVTGTTAATDKAAIATNTLFGQLQILQNKFVTYVTTANTANTALGGISWTIKFLSNNMDTLLRVGEMWLAYIVITRTATAAWAGSTLLLAKGLQALNFIQGVGTVINGQYAAACFASEAGMYGMATASFFLELGLWGTLGVLGLVAAAIGAITFNMTDGYDQMQDYTKMQKNMIDGFNKMPEAINKETIAWQQYIQELKKSQELLNRESYIEYEFSKSKAHGYTAAFLMSMREIGESLIGGGYGSNPVKPNVEMAKLQKEYLPSSMAASIDSAKAAVAQKVELTVKDPTGQVQATKSEGVDVKVDSVWNRKPFSYGY